MGHESSRALLSAGLIVLLALPFAVAAQGEAYLAPSLAFEAGYDSNPYRYADEEGSPFTVVEPAVALSWFRTPETEVTANLAYRQTDHAENPFSSIRSWNGDATVWRYADCRDLSATLAAGQTCRPRRPIPRRRAQRLPPHRLIHALAGNHPPPGRRIPSCPTARSQCPEKTCPADDGATQNSRSGEFPTGEDFARCTPSSGPGPAAA